MPLSDVDLIQRRFSVGLKTDLVDFIVYSYDEQTFEENYFKSAHDLIDLFGKQTEGNKCYWIEVINRSSVELPNNMKKFCEHFDIHPLTIEDITTIAPYMKLDLINDQAAVYLLMKIISWNGHRVEQQQISFYLKYSQNILITFQERAIGIGTVFNDIRNRLQRQNNSEEQCPYTLYNRLKQMNVDYLLYCLLDTIIERYREQRISSEFL
jgi:magnesium transporter